MARVDSDKFLASLEDLGEAEVRKRLAAGQTWEKPKADLAAEWLRQQHQERSDRSNLEQARIARSAKNAAWAAAIAAMIAAISAIVSVAISFS